MSGTPELSPRRRLVYEHIREHPGSTQTEMAEAIFGPGALQSTVTPSCLYLIKAGLVEHRGLGVPGDPYRYYIWSTPTRGPSGPA